jgi:hypothetical protein
MERRHPAFYKKGATGIIFPGSARPSKSCHPTKGWRRSFRNVFVSCAFATLTVYLVSDGGQPVGSRAA